MKKSQSDLQNLISQSKELFPLLPSSEKVEELMKNWQKCLPGQLGDLFTRETLTGIKRYDTYELNTEFVKFIVHKLDKKKCDRRVVLMSIIMGKGKIEKEESIGSLEPSAHIFQPVLKVVLNKSFLGHKVFNFILYPTDIIFSLKLSNMQNFIDQQISPKVAELFILKWQALSDGNLVNAFEGLAAQSVTVDESGERGNVVFGEQKLSRVKMYTFDTQETRAIIKAIKKGFKADKELSFFVNLGAGLDVADFHPFNFRPIIRIDEKDKDASFEDDTATSDYFDTSKPCPPFCSDGEV